MKNKVEHESIIHYSQKYQKHPQNSIQQRIEYRELGSVGSSSKHKIFNNSLIFKSNRLLETILRPGTSPKTISKLMLELKKLYGEQ